MLNTFDNADLNQTQKKLLYRFYKNWKSSNPGFLIFCASQHDLIKETNFEKVGTCVAKLCRSRILGLDPPLVFSWNIMGFLILAFKEVTKWYLSHYSSSLVIIFFKRVYVGQLFLAILLKSRFLYVCAFFLFCFESNVLHQVLKHMCYH